MSERFHLPVVEQPAETDESSIEHERRLELKIARAFLKNRYPLSEQGELLCKKTEMAIKHFEEGDLKPLESLKEELPTVEHPKLELFKDFDLTREQELITFGPNLACVQVSKGCRHHCEHCAADAGKRVEHMPFAAVLKIAEELKKNQGEQAKLFEDWRGKVSGFLRNNSPKGAWNSLKERIFALHPYLSEINDADDYQYLVDGIYAYARKNDSEEQARERAAVRVEALKLYESARSRFREEAKLLEDAEIVKPYLPHRKRITRDFVELSPFQKEKPQYLCHYNDSDPFDYRDTSFLHEDGTPADYGDVFLAHMPVTESISITTAGWPKNDHISQRAAEKIIRAIRPFAEERQRLYKEHGGISGKGPRDDGIRISIHPFERGLSRGDMTRYREDLENVIRTCDAVNPDLNLIESDDREEWSRFLEEVVLPLRRQMQDLKFASEKLREIEKWERWQPVSHFSGRAKKEEADTGDWDIMACMKGIHIRPNGSVAKQEESLETHDGEKDSWIVTKGTRPRPLGFSLYQLERKGKK